ncbi:MAG: sugar phosphate nucleotidyltransferase [Ferruginibacter sp.]|nr:nucleotidyltransferase [Bacteroidota bacterium]MBX2919389.1 nucleotidyltransferase [Ferruginibacter sp.]MCB0709534.1 nucleotidyltransferase [Chitinophagaceae bacterium]MCC7378307.1 nucleotidyltransferase [Chitinophagaceae bacterium]
MKPTLLILAAGMASRYGSMKQTEGFGPSGETIMDYSIYDAIRAGFDKVVFIIREDFAESFKATFEPKLKGKIKTDYVYQEMNAYLGTLSAPANRTKPWGTGHAVLCAKDAINEPFAVINADDFYGRDAFMKAADFLKNKCNDKTYSIIGYELEKTLSDHGSVSRGVCQVDENNNLVSIKERTKIYKENNNIIYEEEDGKHLVSPGACVSMNFWCFHPSLFNITENLFLEFVKENMTNLKAEFFIPIIAEDFVKNRGGHINVIPTSSKWFGVTYKEDAPFVKACVDKLIADEEYPASLWS